MHDLDFVVLNGSAHINKVGTGFGLDLGQIADPIGVALGNGLGNGRNGTVNFFANNDHSVVTPFSVNFNKDMIPRLRADEKQPYFAKSANKSCTHATRC